MGRETYTTEGFLKAVKDAEEGDHIIYVDEESPREVKGKELKQIEEAERMARKSGIETSLIGRPKPRNVKSDKQTIQELCEKAQIKKPFIFSSWVFMRAAGVDKNEADSMLGVHRNTLQRYERKEKENLKEDERFKLIKASVNYEYGERIE
jgi:hypothetical protein